jgi:hypothetical protein
MIIGGGSGFVKQIPKGIVIVGIADSFAVVGQGACAAEAVVVVVAGVSVSGLADQVVTVDVAHNELVGGIAFFQNLGIGAVFIDQVVDFDRAVDTF